VDVFIDSSVQCRDFSSVCSLRDSGYPGFCLGLDP